MNKNIDKICCICLEHETENDIENNNNNNNNLIEYNHCGIYNVHKKCLNNWKSNECLICRKKLSKKQFKKIFNKCNESNESNERNNNITILMYNDYQNYQNLYNMKICSKFCIIFNIVGIGLYFYIKYVL